VVLGPDGVVLAEGRNRVASTGDLRAHAELDAIENARLAGRSAAGGTMVASGEPCPMCSAGMVWAGVARIVFAAAEPDFFPILGEGPRFTLRCAEVVGSASVEVAVEGPVGGEAALEVFREYARS
jgi:tRNA(Arg) A34 adenosine deaminase TadA